MAGRLAKIFTRADVWNDVLGVVLVDVELNRDVDWVPTENFGLHYFLFLIQSMEGAGLSGPILGVRVS